MVCRRIVPSRLAFIASFLFLCLFWVDGGIWADQHGLSHLPDPIKDKVLSLLAAADKDIAADRLAGPDENNALAKYLEVATLDPGNQAADQGLSKVATLCIEKARSLAEDGDLDQADLYLQYAQQAGHPKEDIEKVRVTLSSMVKVGGGPGQPSKPSSKIAPPTEGGVDEPEPEKPSPPEQSSPAPPGSSTEREGQLVPVDPSLEAPNTGGPTQPGSSSGEIAVQDQQPSTGSAPQPSSTEYERVLQGERTLRMALEALADGQLLVAERLIGEARDLIPEEPSIPRLEKKIKDRIRKRKKSAQAKVNLAKASYKTGDLDKAKAYLNEAAEVLGWGGEIATLKRLFDAESRTSAPPQGTSEFVNSFGIKFVLIPAGEFFMGRDMDAGVPENEQPRHPVKITKPFYLSKYEITQGQWLAVMGYNRSNFYDEDGLRPVESISLDEISVFLKRMTQQDTSRIYRLPTEAEWEYACRAGTTTLYSFGDNPHHLDRHAWYLGGAGFRTHPVGLKAPNPWGLHDMHGNVWEWVNDTYNDFYYAQSETIDPPGPQGRGPKVVRGGSFLDGPRACQSSVRTFGKKGFNTGFRVAISWD